MNRFYRVAMSLIIAGLVASSIAGVVSACGMIGSIVPCDSGTLVNK